MEGKLPKSISSLTDQVQKIPLDMIREGVVTLRVNYDDAELDELGNSIVAHKQIQSIVVQPSDDGQYDLVIGSRRLRAAKLKGMPDIAAYIIERRSPAELLFIALAENLHRVDLDPFEEAQAFLRLIKEYGLEPRQVAAGINRSGDYVRKRLQLLSMPEEVATLVSARKLNISFVSVLARLPTGDMQTRLAQQAVQHHLSESELRAAVTKALDEPERPERQSHELTAVKVQARIDGFVSFLQKVPRRMKLRRLNADDKSKLLKSLQAMEDEIRLLREQVRSVQTVNTSSSVVQQSGVRRNHGQEWTSEDIRKISSPRRPSDEELSSQLGRSVGAIQQMRAKTQEKT